MARREKPSGRKIGKSRSVSDLRRVRGFKPPSKVVVIVCEGKKTEPLYFNAIRKKLRISTLNIKVIPEQGAPIAIVNVAISEKNNILKSDEVWCVFDFEQVGKNPTFFKAVEKARSANLKLAISNPAFEYWYLLHFKQTSQPFIDADQVKTYLMEYLPDYQKNICPYNVIESKTDTAIQIALELRQMSEDGWANFPNPSTGVDTLVAELLSIRN